MASKTIKKKKSAPATPRARQAKKKSSARKKRVEATTGDGFIPRATSGYDEDDVLLSGGGMRGASYGRCGGRVLSTRIEQNLCDKLSRVGVTHSHSPRHFEVQIDQDQVGAYAPMIVLRGRGRAGKTVVIEAAEEQDPVTLGKIAAFREKFGQEFYVVFVAPEEVLDEIPLTAYDESCTTTDLDTLVGRLAE